MIRHCACSGRNGHLALPSERDHSTNQLSSHLYNTHTKHTAYILCLISLKYQTYTYTYTSPHPLDTLITRLTSTTHTQVQHTKHTACILYLRKEREHSTHQLSSHLYNTHTKHTAYIVCFISPEYQTYTYTSAHLFDTSHKIHSMHTILQERKRAQHLSTI